MCQNFGCNLIPGPKHSYDNNRGIIESLIDHLPISFLLMPQNSLNSLLFVFAIDPYNWTGTNAVIRGKKQWKVSHAFKNNFFFLGTY